MLGVFHGGVNLIVLHLMMQWKIEDVGSLAGELVETGLATVDPYNHLTLNPALCPYLRGRMEAAEREALTARWVEAMRRYAKFLDQQQHQNAEMSATLTGLELPTLFALLDLVLRAGDAEATIDLATSLYRPLEFAGRPRLLERVAQVRDAAAAALGDAWNHARFQAEMTRIEQQAAGARLREALAGAEALLQRARATGGQAYLDADYDLAMACWLLARVLQMASGAEQALPLLDEARQRFDAFAKVQPGRGAEMMTSVCITDQANCLLYLGRLDEAAAAYEEGIRSAEQLGDDRQVAVGYFWLGTVRLYQHCYPEALAAYAEARERFTALNEPSTISQSWHQTGMVYEHVGQPEAAEDAYRKALAISVRLGDVTGQAKTLDHLGILYGKVLGRPEEAAAFHRQAADRYVEVGDAAGEGRARSNLASTLRRLPGRLDEARRETRRAIECGAQFSHVSEPWKTWNILANIETEAGNPSAAAQARAKAIACYLAYRRDGGENHSADGRISPAVTQSLRAGDLATAASLLQELAADPDLPTPARTFIRALQAIVTGSRDRRLADAPELDYTMAAEILFLIETLEQQR